MDKQDLINLLDNLNISKSEYYLVSGSALLFYGIKEKTGDLDICISEELFKEYKDKYISKYLLNDHFVYQLTKEIDFIVKNKDDFNTTIIDGYQLENLNEILEFKQNRNLEKDQLDIKNIIDYQKHCN